jgi:glycerophosphoryl diester phosphodiesterase
MEIVGHRGACAYAPENTLQSFAKAIELGCDRAELDVHLSSDNVPVVIHDSTLERTTNGKGLVANLTLAELKALDAGSGQQIPTLREVMDFCRNKISLQIELKATGSPPLVAALTEEAWGVGRLVVTSFDLSLLKQFGALLPAVPLGLLNRDPRLDMIATAETHGHRWICPRFDIATPDLVTQAKSKRLQVYVYHVNNTEIAHNLLDWGVDAIGTDYPDLLRRAV